MYVQGFVVPVPEQNRERYLEMARFMGEIMRENGALEIVEAWEEDIVEGKHTDFRMAVKAEPGEKIVFSWVCWPDKATADASHAAMMADDRMQGEWDMPFSGQRMIMGGFAPILAFGRGAD